MKVLSLIIFLFLTTYGFSQTKEENNSVDTPVRAMSPDRPDVTESPITVAKGYFQLETDLVKFSTKKVNGVTFKETDFTVMNLKYGISKSIDLQLVIESIVITKAISPGFKETRIGSGDMTFRIKKNIFGNDEGKYALAVMPFINIPAGRKDSRFSAGIVVPLSVSIGNDWEVGTQLQTTLVREESNKKLIAENLFSLTAGHTFWNNFDFFIETVIINSQKQWSLFGNSGITYTYNPNLKMDAGFYLGLTGSNMKTYFLGLSFRI